MALKEKKSFYRQLYNIFTLKVALQAMDVLFKFIVIKKLSVQDVGIYLYVLSIIMFFQNFATMGMSTYIQRQIARGEFVDNKYINSTFWILSFSSIFAYFLLPVQTVGLKPYIVFIIISNMITNLVMAISNGSGEYDTKYRFQLLMSLYMGIILINMLFKKPITLHLLFYAFFINSLVGTGYAYTVFLRLREHLSIKKCFHEKFYDVLLNLLLIYAVAMPYDFSRFYDRFLLNHYFTSNLLGVYAFNNYLVVGIYSLMVKPMMSVCITALSKAKSNIEQHATIICRYYLYTLLIFSLIFVGYAPFSKSWLELLGLTSYAGTTYIFIFAFFNTLLYALSIPFIIKISISSSKIQKLIYCCVSMLIFNVPLLFISLERQFIFFLYGFLIAFALNFITAIIFNYSYAKAIFRLILSMLGKLIRGGRTELLAFINPNDS